MTAVAKPIRSSESEGASGEEEPGQRQPTGWARARLILLLGSLIAISPLTIDMYLPALPAITDDLRASPSLVQLTLTGTLLGIGLGQLIVGPLSDAFGRRRPLIIGLLLHVLASLACVVAPSAVALGVLRLLQGLAVAAASVVAAAVVRDQFTGSAAAKVFSRLLLVMGVAPILAPVLGSQLLRWTHWRGIFAVLAAFGLVLALVAALGLRESLPPERRRRAGLRPVLQAYRSLLRDKVFVGLVLVAGLSFAALFAYVSGSSFVLQGEYGLDEQQFGLVFGFGACFFIAGSQLNAALLNRFPPQRMLLIGLTTGTAAGVALLVVAATGFGGVPGIMVPVFGVLCSLGLAVPNGSAIALTRHGEAAGTAAAMLGTAQFGTGALAAPLVGLLGGSASVGMGTVVAAALVGALTALHLLVLPGIALRPQPSGAQL